MAPRLVILGYITESGNKNEPVGFFGYNTFLKYIFYHSFNEFEPNTQKTIQRILKSYPKAGILEGRKCIQNVCIAVRDESGGYYNVYDCYGGCVRYNLVELKRLKANIRDNLILADSYAKI